MTDCISLRIAELSIPLSIQIVILFLMADPNLNQSQLQLLQGECLDNQNNNTLLDQETSAINSQSDLYDDPSRLEYGNQEEKKNDSNEKESHIDLFAQRITFEDKVVRTKNHKSLLRGLMGDIRRDVFLFVCFGERKVQLTREDIQAFLTRKFGEDYNRNNIHCRCIVEEVIRKLCYHEYGFQPCLIKTDSFTLAAIEGDGPNRHETPINDFLIEDLQLFTTFSVGRVPRPLLLSKYYQQLQEKQKDVEVLEVLSPDQRDLIEVIERSKTYGDLKEKLLSYYYQMVGKIVLVSYNSFRLIDNHKKVSDLNERIVEIYQERACDYRDKAFKKTNDGPATFAEQLSIINIQGTGPLNFQERLVSESLIFGNLYLQIKENKLYERYSRGLVGYFTQDRLRCRSLLTLVSAKALGRILLLQFKYKDRQEVVQYFFKSLSVLTELISAILVVIRLYNHRIEVMK